MFQVVRINLSILRKREANIVTDKIRLKTYIKQNIKKNQSPSKPAANTLMSKRLQLCKEHYFFQDNKKQLA